MSIDRMEEQRLWKGLTLKQKRGFYGMIQEGTVVDGKFYDKHGNDQSHRVQLGINTTQNQFNGVIMRSEFEKFEKEQGGFVFAMFDSLTTMDGRFPDLSQSDLARLMFIGTYTAWADGQLIFDNGVPIQRKHLEKLLGMSRNKVVEFYERLVECEIIVEDEAGDLHMNPTVFYRGYLSEHKYDISDLAYTRLFRKTVRELYEAYNGRTIKQLAVLYAVLPFVNFSYNVVCYNPTEPNQDLLKPITVAKLAALLGYKRTEDLVKIMDKIKYEDKRVFAYFGTESSKGKRGMLINPRAVYAGKPETLKTAMQIFEWSERLG
jgi:hypothetical protein